MTNLSSEFKMTDAMERELNDREHNASQSWEFSGSAEHVYLAAVVAVFCIGVLLAASIFY